MTTDAPLMGEPLSVELMNTVWADRDGVHDSLADLDGARNWLAASADRLDVTGLRQAALVDTSPSTLRALRQLCSLRDSLRLLAADVTDDHRATAQSGVGDLDVAVATLNRTARTEPQWPVLDLDRIADGTTERVVEWQRTTRSAHGPTAAAVTAIAAHGIALLAGEDRRALRACHAPGCVLYFVKQHPRRAWCSAACGNRARVARYYQRHASS